MKNTVVDPASLVPVGKVEGEISGDMLKMTTTRAIHDVGYNIRRDKVTSYMLVPGQYRVPFKIDLSVCVDTPEWLLLIGDGHISFGSPWMENRRIEDIVSPADKPKTYDNRVPFGAFADISVIYNPKEMQILIDGEERYYSTKERYMKSERFSEQNDAGFFIGLTCTKRADLCIRSISVGEYDKNIPITRCVDMCAKPPVKVAERAKKHTFDSCIEGLPPVIKAEIVKTEAFLKSLRNLKFKRIIEKHGNKITYVESGKGISYAIYISDGVMHHSFQWYIVTNGKPESWHRVANPMEAVLDELRIDSPELADRIFYNLNECVGCRDQCLAKTPYTYQSRRIVSCHGHVFFKMCASDFQDVREFFAGLNRMVQANGGE